MRVKMLADRSKVLDAVNSKTWPRDWEGEVPDELAIAWLGETPPACEPLPATPAAGLKPGQQFTEVQASVLAAAADQIIAAHLQQEQEQQQEEQDGQQVIPLEELTDEELRDLAKKAKIKGYNVMRRETLLAKLHEALEASEGTEAGA